MLRLLEAFRKSLLWKAMICLQKVLLVLTSVFVVLIMCAEVLLRYVFHSDLFGIEEVVVIAAFWLYFIGSSYGVYERSHVKADIVSQLLSRRSRAILSVINRFTMVVLCLVFSWWAVDMVRYGIEWMPRTTGLRIPIVISQSSILLGYVLMSLYSIVYFLEEFCNLFVKKEKAGVGICAK